MKVWSDSITPGETIPSEFAFGRHDAESHVALCENRNPHIAWSDLPADTRSVALIIHDDKVPSRPDDVNQEGRTVPHDLPRVDFTHWVLIDVDPAAGAIPAGSFSEGITAGGKDGPATSGTARQGVNDYTSWFAGDADMGGTYFGYDGPCPPWNDELVHDYHFTLYALDVDRLAVDGAFSRADALAAMEGHILAEASFSAPYAIYPDARR